MDRRFGFALCMSAVAALLTGCTSTESALGPVPQAANAREGTQGSIQPNASGDLLYAASSQGGVYIFSYPSGKLVGGVGNAVAAGECSDAAGDVFVTTIDAGSTTGTVYEYAHGRKKPIAVLSDPGYPNGCAVDPSSGNLAVANLQDTSSSNPYAPDGDVAIYAAAKGSPTMYYSQTLRLFAFCGYDPSGNLFLSSYDGSSYGLARLASGSATFETITLDKQIFGASYPSVQWDGHYITISSLENTNQAPAYIHQLSISGSNATVVRTVKLANKKEHHIGQILIDGGTVIAIAGKGHEGLFSWKYPKGGKSHQEIATKGIELWGLALSRGHAR